MFIKSVQEPLENRPPPASYDSGYEHSLGHFLHVQMLVEEAYKSTEDNEMQDKAAA